MSRVLIALGVACLVLGIGWRWFREVPLFHLPGDIIINRPGFRFYFPLTSMLLLSAVISAIAWAMRK